MGRLLGVPLWNTVGEVVGLGLYILMLSIVFLSCFVLGYMDNV
jgi:hypothetical protein